LARSAVALTLIAAIAGFAFAIRDKQWLPRFAFD
jgi:hypothetical protein